MPTNAALLKQMEWRGRHENPTHAEQAYLDFRKANPQLKRSSQYLDHFGKLFFDRRRGPPAFPRIADHGADHRAIYRDGVTGLYAVVCHPYGGGRHSVDVVKQANECQLQRWEPKLGKRFPSHTRMPDRLLCQIAPTDASWYGATTSLVVIASERVEVVLPKETLVSEWQWPRRLLPVYLR